MIRSQSTTSIKEKINTNSYSRNDSGLEKTSVNDSKDQVRKTVRPVANYLKSTNSSLNKRADVSSEGLKRSGSIRASKSQSDLRKRDASVPRDSVVRKKIVSTPVGNHQHSLNFSGASSIKSSSARVNKSPQGSRVARRIENIGPAVRMVTSNGQASRRNLNGGDYNGMAKMPLKGLMVGHDQESRNKELELNMGRSVYIRSMYLRVAADREVKSIEKEGLMQINHLWTYNKKLLERNLNVKKQNSEMSKMLETLKTLTAYEDLLNKYEAVQAEVASAFVSVSRELMAGSSRLRIVGIPEEQRERLKDLLRNSPKLTKQNREKYEQISALAYQMSQLSAHLKGTMSLSGNCERMVSSIEESNKKLETFRKVQRSIQE